jgi:hypothetical protein
MGLPLCLGLSLVAPGCGSSQAFTVEPLHRVDEGPTAPESTVAQLTGCAERGALRLSDTHYAIIFDVNATESGRVREAKVRDSIIPDRGMESCMVRALEAMAVPGSVMAMRSSHRASNGLISPESRGHTGNVLVLGAAIELAPILIVAAGVTILVAVTVHLMSDASSSPHDATDEQRERERCKRVLERCIEKCTDETLPTGTFNGDPFFKCRRQCLEAENCLGVRLN